jgi:formylglycine-generating enzyme required for sulfatase activity
MRLVRIRPGAFRMGVGRTPLPKDVAGRPWRSEGDFDEKPVHRVTISRPFHMGVTEVTNAQYERFDPEHRRLRGMQGFSKGDDEAVVFVSWHDAVAFCEWLSKKEGRTYRLPTEAEWEYACRAGTTTHYHTGDHLPKDFQKGPAVSWYPDDRRKRENDVVPLTVGARPSNAWGLLDMHGNVEEWCHDWYGPYHGADQADPVGRSDGDFRVTRGGSHSTEFFYLRSANRLGAPPEDRSWVIGFRVVLGELPQTKPLPAMPPALHQQNVAAGPPHDLTKGPDPAKPYFRGPRVYVKIPPGSNGPMYSNHNHDPALVECPNGDLLAVWYSCVQEPGRELGILASRLRCGADAWEPASVFWNAPDRNDHAPALWADEQGTLYHFNGLSAAATWGNLATVLRTSTDSGATWSRARLINPVHRTRQMPVESVFRTREGHIILPCDAVSVGSGGTAIHVSRDNGATWADAGGKAAGIHAGIVQLKDGRLMALGRGDNVDGRMPKSISADLGKTWHVTASPFPPIGGGQRLVLTRLKEGPIFFASFAKRMVITDAAGAERPVSGLFGALSYDEGETWKICRHIVADDATQQFDGGAWTRRFTMDHSRAEPKGYLSVCQTPDGVIQLISSRLHYAFNLKWLTTPAPAGPKPPKPKPLPKKATLENVYVPTGVPSRTKLWRFTGSGIAEEQAISLGKDGMTLDAGRNQRARWVDDSPDGFGRVDAAKGFTVEMRLQVLKSTSASRGIDLEASAGGRRYFITITRTAALWHDGGFTVLADGLDNHSAAHTYRISVRRDGVAQVTRDGKPLGMRRPGSGTDPLLKARGAYLQWGEGAGGSEADARVEHVAYDLNGAFD